MSTAEKIVEILSDDILWGRFSACTTKEDGMALLAEHGVDASLDEVREAVIAVAKKKALPSGENGELSEADLEQVSGGIFAAYFRSFLAWLFG